MSTSALKKFDKIKATACSAGHRHRAICFIIWKSSTEAVALQYRESIVSDSDIIWHLGHPIVKFQIWASLWFSAKWHIRPKSQLKLIFRRFVDKLVCLCPYFFRLQPWQPQSPSSWHPPFPTRCTFLLPYYHRQSWSTGNKLSSKPSP